MSSPRSKGASLRSRSKSSGVPRCGSMRRRAPNSKPMGTNKPVARGGGDAQGMHIAGAAIRRAGAAEPQRQAVPRTAPRRRRSRAARCAAGDCALRCTRARGRPTRVSRRTRHRARRLAVRCAAPTASPGVQPRKRHDGHSLFTPAISAFTKCAGTSASPSSRNPAAPAFARRMSRSTHHAVSSSARCGSSKRAGTASRPRLAWRGSTTSAAPDR